MPYIADTPYDLSTVVNEQCSYIISSQHRRTGNPDKSIWIISHDEELDCFVFSYRERWFELNIDICWGIYILGNNLQVIGRNADGFESKIAKFIDSNRNTRWHGYPADYFIKSQDRPPTEILQRWVIDGYISKPSMSRIRTGKKCNL